MTDEVALVMWIARWVAIWHLGVALYLVGFAEKKTFFLMGIAFLKAALGTLIYTMVLDPDWAFLDSVNGLILPLALALLGIISVVFTWLLWQVYNLDNPGRRLFWAVIGWIVVTRNAIRKVTR